MVPSSPAIGPLAERSPAGAKLTASKVIVTVPLGVLKAKAATMFTPALPAKKMQSIGRMGNAPAAPRLPTALPMKNEMPQSGCLNGIIAVGLWN